MAVTYEPIATTTLGSAQATVTFSSIPSTYTDLVLVYSGLISPNGAGWLQMNSDTGTNYSLTNMSGNGTATSSNRLSSVANTSNYYGAYWLGLSSTDTNTVILQIMNYANTTTYKTWLSRSAAKGVEACVGLWRSTSAITSITLGMQSTSTYSSGSTFTLYGIKAA